MTFEEKATKWLEDNILLPDEELIKELTILLKEQDRDTRHKCAESVLIANDSDLIEKSYAHSAIMNTKGG